MYCCEKDESKGVCFIKEVLSKKPIDSELNITNNLKYLILTFYASAFVVFGLLMDSPSEIIKGLLTIIRTPDVLITDYIALVGMGATFVNAGLLTLISIYILYRLEINISGVSIAAIFLMTGFALFGKNLFNVWLIILGVYLYAKVQKDKFSKYIYIALFGTSMAPTITELMFSESLPVALRIGLSLFIGLGIGFILPPLSTYLLKVHQGYNLYNIGFTAGMMSTVIVSLFRSYGFVFNTTLIWSTGNNKILGIFLVTMFLSMILIGYILNGKTFKGLKRVYKYTGRLICDFVILEGFGVTLINMGINGLIATAYIFIVRGQLNGPTIGGILTIVGFSAFGKHAKNMIPIFIGVVLGSLTKVWNINDPAILLAALFGTALSPISGEFGWKYGVLAGFINSSVVLNVGALHGGLNLYNTGFAAGLVAAIMIPIIKAFRKEEI